MIAQNRSYPHPVLAPFRDDVLPNVFELSLGIDYDADNYYLDIGINHENSTLSGLLTEQRAMLAAHVECRRNFYRHLYRISGSSERITIRASDLLGRVEVTPCAVAIQAIERYRVDGAHSDYGDAVFAIRRGDILAIGNTATFQAYNDYDPLKRLSSILTIQRSDSTADGPMLVDTNGDRIIVTLSQEDYDLYTTLRGDPALTAVLANQVVVPALLQALFEMASDQDEAIEEGMARRWYRSVDAKLTATGINLRNGTLSPLDALQKLLRGPLRRSLAGLAQATFEDVADQ